VVALLRREEPAEEVRARRIAQALDARIALEVERRRIDLDVARRRNVDVQRAGRGFVHVAHQHIARRDVVRVVVPRPVSPPQRAPARLARHLAEPADEPLLVRLLADDARVAERQERQREAQRDVPRAGHAEPERAPAAHRRAPHVWSASSRVGILFRPSLRGS